MTTTRQLDADNPWPGLDAFEENAHAFFHGRTDEAAALLRSVLDSPMTVLYGRSGLGKTSLLRAALFPVLRANDFLPIYVRLDFKRGAPAIDQQLRACISDVVRTEVPSGRPPADDESVWEYLHRADLELWSTQNFPLTPVIVIDQFEEIFTLGPQVPGLVERFRNDFGDLVENRIPAHLGARIKTDDVPSTSLALRSRNYIVLVSLREDFLPDLEDWRQLIPLLGRPRQRLLPMTGTAALQAVIEPAGDRIASAQAEHIVRFIAGEHVHGQASEAPQDGGGPSEDLDKLSVEPALLSLFCRELNETRKRRGQAEFDDQLIEGAKSDVLTSYYDRCLADLPRRVADFIESQLITQKGYRNSYARDDAVPEHLTEDELSQLINSRLVRIEERYGTQRIELSHDVLTGVVRAKRDQRKADDERDELAARVAADREAADERERALEQQRLLEQRKRLQSERAQRRLRWLSAGLAVLLVIATAAVVISVNQYNEARSQRGLAFSRQLAGQAASVVDRQPQLAILLGLESLSAARDAAPEAPPALVTALARNTRGSQQFVGHMAGVFGVAFSPDSKQLATASADGSVRLWDTKTAEPRGEPLTGRMDTVLKVAFSPDGRLLASVGDDGIPRLQDSVTGWAHGQPLTGHIGAVNGVAFSPDGSLLATAGSDRTVRLWDTATSELRGILTGHTNFVLGVAFNHDGTLLASASADRTVLLWDIGTGQPRGQPLAGHTDTVFGIAFNHDGTLLATASADNTARLWNTSTGQPSGQPLIGHVGPALGVAFGPDGTFLATAGADGTARLWDIATGQQRGQALTGHTRPVLDVRFSPDGRSLATASLDQTARLWDTVETPSVSRSLIGHTNYVLGTAVSPDGSLLATASADRTVLLWDTATGQRRGAPLTGHTDTVFAVAFSPDGTTLATASADGTVRLWDATTWTPRSEPLTGHTGAVLKVAFSPDSTLLVTAGDDRTVRLWYVATGQPRGGPLAEGTDTVFDVAFSPDGRFVAATAGRTVQLWDIATGRPYGRPLAGHTDAVFGVAFSPDGMLLATAGADETVRLWDIATGRPHGPPLTGHAGAVLKVAFNRDGTRLGTVGEDRTARLWDTAAGQPHGQPLAGHTDYVYAVAFSPDSAHLATSSADRTARLWDLRFRQYSETGCKLVKRNLTQAEWNQFAGDQPYERTCRDYPSGEGAPLDAPVAEYTG